MPGLEDPGFQQAVTYICEHHEGGAMGLVINQPLTLTIEELFSQLSLDVKQESMRKQCLHYGGPVKKERGFVLHTSEKSWEGTLPITDDIAITGSRDILQDMASGEGPESLMMALGYAGWDSGQLEKEIAENSWLTVPADKDIIFEVDYKERWASAAAKLGVDVALISNTAGHA